MDISAILPVMGQDSSRCLNDEFSGQTSAGDNIFSKPMGARTFFRTASGGLVVASFIFDPSKVYGEDHNMASVTSDWMLDMRDALTKQLLDPKDIVSKTKTLEETMWDQMTSLLPKETLAKNLFADKATFDAYTDLLKKNVEKNFNEEKCLTEKMNDSEYSFSFEVAIDAYPSALGGNNEQKTGEDRTGVLTFHLGSIPDGKIPEPKPEADETAADSNRKSKKRKTRDGEGDKKSDVKKLIKELGLQEMYAKSSLNQHKTFPHSASQFFENLNRWFSSVVSRKAAKLEKANNRNPIYH